MLLLCVRMARGENRIKNHVHNSPFIICPDLTLIKDQKILLLRHTKKLLFSEVIGMSRQGKLRERNLQKGTDKETFEEIGLRY